MREKLIELLNKVQDMGVTVIPAGMGDRYDHVWNQKVADHLIANGVTIPVRCGECIHRVKGTWAKCMGRLDDEFCSDGERRFRG